MAALQLMASGRRPPRGVGARSSSARHPRAAFPQALTATLQAMPLAGSWAPGNPRQEAEGR
eukprot:7889412-Lingulodinium_polyedra.AAC.1